MISVSIPTASEARIQTNENKCVLYKYLEEISAIILESINNTTKKGMDIITISFNNCIDTKLSAVNIMARKLKRLGYGVIVLTQKNNPTEKIMVIDW